MLAARWEQWEVELKAEGRREGLLDQLHARFGRELPGWVQRQLQRATNAELRLWGKKVLKAASLHELFGRQRRVDAGGGRRTMAYAYVPSRDNRQGCSGFCSKVPQDGSRCESRRVWCSRSEVGNRNCPFALRELMESRTASRSNHYRPPQAYPPMAGPCPAVDCHGPATAPVTADAWRGSLAQRSRARSRPDLLCHCNPWHGGDASL
jgi:hypothetical protein